MGRGLHCDESQNCLYRSGYDEYGSVLMVTTSAAMVSKDVALFTLQESANFDELVRKLGAKPLWNGEDCLLSVASAFYNFKHSECKASFRDAPPFSFCLRPQR